MAEGAGETDSPASGDSAITDHVIQVDSASQTEDDYYATLYHNRNPFCLGYFLATLSFVGWAVAVIYLSFHLKSSLVCVLFTQHCLQTAADACICLHENVYCTFFLLIFGIQFAIPQLLKLRFH